MSRAFFDVFDLPTPDLHLNIGSGTHGEQTGRTLMAYEQACLAQRPDWTIVVGDVNATIACALAASKLGIRVAHLEAGLRSRDRSMPEEINRVLVDAIADLLWTPSADADANLAAEGIPAERIAFVGNIMIDTLCYMRPRIEAAAAPARYGLTPSEYALVTFHRPINVDDANWCRVMVDTLARIAHRRRVIWPMHPRTAARLRDFGLYDALAAHAEIQIVAPLDYVLFMGLLCDARLVITDSGGLQEETTYLGIPCLTVRETTERPITVSRGTNRLTRIACLAQAIGALDLDVPSCATPADPLPLWDGHSAERIVESLWQNR